jgi:carbon monoxide dehydrogenase subunit G
MKPVTVTRHINAPVDRVEALFTDLEHAADHITGIKRVEMLTEGPFGVGTRWKETRVMFGKEATEEMEITEYVPGDHYVAEAESCGAHYRSVVRYEPSGEGTDVTMEFGAEPISFLAKLMTPLSGLMTKTLVKCIEQDLSDLAQIAESAEQQTT